jgi:flagellar basal-body rod modification protein FlgD
MITSVRNAFGNARFDTTPTTPPTPTTPAVAGAEPPIGAAEPSAPRTLPTNKSGMGRDEFLKMLVAQLKNQDPLNPMDGKDMAAQLAQFSTVEQLIMMNKSMDEQKAAAAQMTDAIQSLEETQNQRADELAQLIEGQMAMSTVGKIGVTPGNNAFVDRDGTGTIMVDTGRLTGIGRITMIDSEGATVGQAIVGEVREGQQSFDVGDYTWDPPLKPGKYTFKFEVAKDGNPYVAAKTYTAGRITGMRYQDGNPILMIGDSISVPMSQLTQIRA